jgi:glucoside 3-dehydrogenase (cytochrome c) hitch-hiker subunit
LGPEATSFDAIVVASGISGGWVEAEAQKVGPTHYFTLVRELALRAYFSSEVGMTKALRYVLVPGKWVGCVPLEPGQPAWG